MPKAITYTNRKGRKYHLCETKTKKGKPRFVFSREPRGKPVFEMPDGYEISESINGQVSLRKVVASPISDDEILTVRTIVRRQAHLTRYRVDVRKDAIVVYEPVGGIDEGVARMLGLPREAVESLSSRVQYSPVLRFILVDVENREFIVERMCYRGSVDGWLPLHDAGHLAGLAPRYVAHIGKESFFELY